MGTGRVGGHTSLRTAVEAGVCFRLKKAERKQLAKARREFLALRQVITLRGGRDMSPRLVKRTEAK